MLKKGLWTILAVIAITIHGKSQLKSDQAIPADFKIEFENKFNTDYLKYAGRYKNDLKHKENLSNFFSGSIYGLQLLYKSGKIVFNKRLYDYVNAVLEKVLTKEQELYKNLRIHIIRSSYVNAFTFYNGDIFVTLGLLAQLENEAQLAYILAHEASHYKLEHHVNTVVVSKSNLKKVAERNSIDEEAEELMEYAFSRELEFEADSLGFIYTKNSPYASKSAISAMDVLQYSYLPFNELEFTPKYLFADSVDFPKYLLLDKIHTIDFDSDKEEDSRSTHPNVAKRRKYLVHLADKLSHNSGATNLLGKKEFNEIREISRREVCGILIREGDATMALYNAFIIDKEKSDVYSKELLVKSMYEAAMQKVNNKFNSNNPTESYNQGEIERAHYFLSQSGNEQLMFMTLYNAFNLYSTEKKPFYKALSSQLVDKILQLYSITLSDLKSYLEPPLPKSLNKDTLINVADTTEEEDSKYSKIRSKKAEVVNVVDTTVVDPGSKFHFKLFKKLISDQEFIDLYSSRENTYFKNNKSATSKSNENSSNTTKVTFNKSSYASSDIENIPIQVNNAILFCPLFTNSLEKYTDFFTLHENQQTIASELNGYFNNTGSTFTTIAFEELNYADIESYNKYCQIMDYVNEILRKDSDYLPVSYEYIQAEMESKQHSHIILTRTMRSKERRSNIGQAVLCGIIAFPLLPAAIYYITTKEKKERCYIAGIDISRHKLVISDYQTIGAGKSKTVGGYYTSFIKK